MTNLSLTFSRNYNYQGQRRSFLSARCAVPVGIPGAVFTLARGSFVFSNGQHLSTGAAEQLLGPLTRAAGPCVEGGRANGRFHQSSAQPFCRTPEAPIEQTWTA